MDTKEDGKDVETNRHLGTRDCPCQGYERMAKKKGYQEGRKNCGDAFVAWRFHDPKTRPWNIDKERMLED